VVLVTRQYRSKDSALRQMLAMIGPNPSVLDCNGKDQKRAEDEEGSVKNEMKQCIYYWEGADNQ